MQRGIGGTMFEPVQPERRDREFTLGPFTLTLIVCGLLAICGLSFVFGYAVGHRNAESSSAVSVPPPVTPAFTPQANAQLKPSASQGGAQQQPVASSDSANFAQSNSATDSAPTSQPLESTQPAAGPAQTSSESVVRTAVPGQPAGQPASGSAVQPALAQSGNIMVQIAAVAHPEDADVLVGALRKRGYAVTSRRDPGDGLLHVQIGPFANRSDAYAMRQKMLNDSYNAIVQQ